MEFSMGFMIRRANIMSTGKIVNIIGGGLAGSEAAYQLARRGISVRLFEMRPQRLTPAHTGGGLAELVCSNSFKSTAPHAAHAGFKQELAALGSLLMKCAPRAQVPAGDALAVDRDVFSREIEKEVLATGLVERITAEVGDLSGLPPAAATIVATGPLTQGALADFIRSLSGGHGLYFYDAIAPVIAADSIDRSIAFAASRYGRGGDDYLNCPFSKEEYDGFYDALMGAEKMDFQDFEEAKYFQGCQPIEAIAATGRDTLRFGPMKPVGLTDPSTGREPYAALQLRIDNLSRSAYNLVGFQTKLKYGEQSRIFRLIPGLESAEFLRLGSMHRNTYICSPLVLGPDFALKARPEVLIAGQVTGVEGYTESSAVGLLAALALTARLEGRPWLLPPADSFLGALCRYIFESDPKEFQPINVHFGLFAEGVFNVPRKDASGRRLGKNDIRALMVTEAVSRLIKWRDECGWQPL